MFVSPYDEQDYLTSENFRILERSDTEVELCVSVIINTKYQGLIQ